MTIDQPGIYTIPAETYHADPCPAPSLSASIARTLLAQSPWHAWTLHPRLNPAFAREERETFDLGNAAHALILEGRDGFAIIDAPDWRTKAAQTARDAARLAGKLPLLAHRWADVQAMAGAVRRQLDAFEDRPRPLAGGKPEQTLVWQDEGGVWCRARLDWLHEDHRTVDDLKSTAASANPEAWSRTMYGAGADVQAAFYLRGLKAVTGRDAAFRFVVVENFEPFALSVLTLAPDALALAERKVAAAIRDWRECLERDRWPGYPTATCWIEAPPWEVARWEQRTYQTQPAPVIDDGRSLEAQLFGDTA